MGIPVHETPNGSQLLAQIDAELSDFRKALEAEGIRVRKPEPYDETVDQYLRTMEILIPAPKHNWFCGGGAQIWPRDAMVTLGNTIIEAAPRTPYNRKDIWGLRPLIRAASLQQSNQWLSIPPPFPDYDSGPFLAGGDIVFDGKVLLIGISGNDTDPMGAMCLKSLIGERYTLQTLKLSPKVLHLDCCLSLIRPGLLVWCPEAFIDPLPEYFDAWEKIPVSLSEAEAMWVNGLPINESSCLWPAHATRVIQSLRAKGQRVVAVPFEVISSFGGTLRCATNPMIRTPIVHGEVGGG